MGSVFFALDTSNVGYLKPEYFVQHAPKILEETIPELEPAKIQSIVKQGSKVKKKEVVLVIAEPMREPYSICINVYY